MADPGDFGFVVWLMNHSPVHRSWNVIDLNAYVLAPIERDLAAVDPESLAFASWAFLSDEAHERRLKGYKIKPEDWQSGPHCWCMDVIAPFGGGSEFMRQMLAIARAEGVKRIWFNRRAKNRFGVSLDV